MASWRIIAPTGNMPCRFRKSHSKMWSALSPSNPHIGHVSVPLLHSTLLQTEQLQMISISYIKVSVGQFSWILQGPGFHRVRVSGSDRATIQVQTGIGLSLKLTAPCSSKFMIFIGRIYFLPFVILMVICFFKANREEQLCLRSSSRDSPDKAIPTNRLSVNSKSIGSGLWLLQKKIPSPLPYNVTSHVCNILHVHRSTHIEEKGLLPGAPHYISDYHRCHPQGQDERPCGFRSFTPLGSM